MSSHREAPEISKDPVADNTDVYAFVSPDKSDTVTIIANYVPLEDPAGGPNFFEFGDDVLYEIHIDNNGDGKPDVTYEFRFTTKVRNPETFLYNTGPISALNSATWNRRQFYSVTKWEKGKTTVLAKDLPCPPCNIGPRSTPNYAGAREQAIRKLPTGETVFAGQRNDGFYVDLGSIFDLADLRPFQNLHLIPTAAAPGVNGTARVQRAHHRDPGPEEAHHAQRHGMPIDPANAERRDRRVGHGEPPQGDDARRGRQDRASPARSCRSPVSATRCSTRSSSRWGTRTAGTRCRRRRTSSSSSTWSTRSWRSCCRSCTPASSRTSPGSTGGAGRPRGDPAHRDPVRPHPGVPELHRDRRRPTCCG